jgi:hypothetical protein
MRSWKAGTMLKVNLRGLSVRADGLFFYLEVKLCQLMVYRVMIGE